MNNHDVQTILLRIQNVYDIYQTQTFFVCLCKMPMYEIIMARLNDPDAEFVIHKRPLNKKAIMWVMQQSRLHENTGMLWEMSLYMSISEMLSMYCEYIKKHSVFREKFKAVLENLFHWGDGMDYENFCAALYFLRLCFVHGKTFVLKEEHDFSRWKKLRDGKPVMINLIYKQRSINIHIWMENLAEWVEIDIHEFIDPEQSLYIIELLYDISVEMSNLP